MKINESKWRSPKWLRKYLDFEINTGKDIIDNNPIIKKWDKMWIEIISNDMDNFLEFLEGVDFIFLRNKEIDEILLNIKNQWRGEFEIFDIYEKWRKKKSDKLKNIFDEISLDYRKDPRPSKISILNPSWIFYIFTNGSTFSMSEILYNLCIITIEEKYKKYKYLISKSEEIKIKTFFNELLKYKSNTSNNTNQSSSNNWKSHPKARLYQNLKDTVKHRKEQLSKMSKSDPNYISLKNELDNAERMINKMKSDYKFESYYIKVYENFKI